MLLRTCNPLSIAQADSTFKCLDMRTLTYATLTFITGEFCLVTQVATVANNDCYSELTAYTVLLYPHWVSFHSVYQYQGHIH